MHIRILSGKYDTARHDEFIETYEQAMGAYLTQKGFRGCRLLTNAETGDFRSVVKWTSEDAMLESEDSGWYQPVIDEVLQFVTTDPQVHRFEQAVAIDNEF